MVQTVSKTLLNSDRPDAQLVAKWADICASKGGSFSVVNAYESCGHWITTWTINWPDGMHVPAELKGPTP